MGKCSFEYNSLSRLELPSSVVTVDSFSFAHNRIEELSTNADTIRANAFANNNLTRLLLPDKDVVVEVWAFLSNDIVEVLWSAEQSELGGLRNNVLDTLVVHSNVRRIGEEAFADNTLKRVVLEEGVVEICNSAFAKISKSGASFKKPSSFRALSFPESLRRIGDGAFWCNVNLSAVTFNDGLEEIGEEAFAGCSLDTVVLPGSVSGVLRGAFGSNGLRRLNLAEGLRRIGARAFQNNSIEEVELPSTVLEIGEYAFDHNEELRRLVIAEGLEEIPSYAFSYVGCQTSWTEGQTEVVLPSSLRRIAPWAFDHSNLKYVELPQQTSEGRSLRWTAYDSETGNVVEENVTFIGSGPVRGYQSAWVSYELRQWNLSAM